MEGNCSAFTDKVFDSRKNASDGTRQEEIEEKDNPFEESTLILSNPNIVL
jgi:hypothetical protein